MSRWMVAPRNRVGFIDEYRGFFVIIMVIYHVMYNVVHVFGVSWSFFDSPFMNVVQRIIVGSFIVVSGISSRYSKKNIKRGFVVLGVAFMITAVTVYFIPEQAIYFGVLHFLGIAMILYGMTKKLHNILPCFWGVVLMVLLAVVTWGIPYSGTVGIPFLFYVPVPEILYGTPYLFALGLPGTGFFSADYVPIIPWIFVFFAGGYLGVFFEQNVMPRWMYKTHSRFLTAVGKKALIIYVLHQPIAFGILWLVFFGLQYIG